MSASQALRDLERNTRRERLEADVEAAIKNEQITRRRVDELEKRLAALEARDSVKEQA